MPIFAASFVRSVGEPGEERAQGPGPTAGVWREGGSAGEPRLLGQFSRGVTVEIFYSWTWYLRIPLIEHHPQHNSSWSFSFLQSNKAKADNTNVQKHFSASASLSYSQNSVK